MLKQEALERIKEGVAKFQSEVFPAQRTMFERLRLRQEPLAMFVTCADARIVPNLFTQTEPGEIFIERNPGNMVPPYVEFVGGVTAGVEYAMVALKVKPGDEVITTAHSWISTSAMITHAGATPVFCDTDGVTFTIDPAAIEVAITPRTVGIIPVHLYGQPADMDAIMAIARKHKLWVIEDCAQAHLARYKGQQVGTFGAVATYSFYPGKNLGAMGDAGAVVTNDSALAEHMTMLARHGGLVKHQHHIEGVNRDRKSVV